MEKIIKLNKTITFMDEDLEKIRTWIKEEKEICDIEEWDFDDAEAVSGVRGDFMGLVLNYLIIEE